MKECDICGSSNNVREINDKLKCKKCRKEYQNGRIEDKNPGQSTEKLGIFQGA